MESGVHGAAACDGDADAAADSDAASLAAADAAADGEGAPVEHAAANTATRARAEKPVTVRMGSVISSKVCAADCSAGVGWSGQPGSAVSVTSSPPVSPSSSAASPRL